ncbi:unnamed protein product [Brachionus calyciflorus]|uniref:Bardet-Biedl syndrome 2 protein homolog n=1 Tax=Brachionus calyciflorus TaxID=104777 RepID=A0A813MWD3_9BILA|nr:unnamed protein product [Brachionus calyciflorus]
MVVPIFSLKLNNKICSRTVSIGKYDGVHPCLTAATLAGKVFIHNPHQKYTFSGVGRTDSEPLIDSSLSLLNVNSQVTSIATGSLDASNPNEYLFIGTKTHILAYDVNNNTDVFYKELPDGANAIKCGYFGGIKDPVAIVGGNCSIMALNNIGDEVLWTVTGDNVCSLELLDFNNDSYNELLVGSEDFDIRVFKDDEIINEMSETEAILALTKLTSNQFGFALANGSVGVYEKNIRTWRIKSRNTAMAIHSFDINADGVPELINGWSSGKIDARNIVNGEVVFKCNMDHSIAGITNADYKMDGIDQLICCSTEGEVRGYKPMPSDVINMTSDRNINQEAMRDLAQRKQNLMLELSNLEEASKPSVQRKFDDFGDQTTGIPSNTQIQSKLSTRLQNGSSRGHVELTVVTNNDTVIRAVIIFAEGIFKGESFVVHPPANRISNDLVVPLFLPKDSPIDIHMQIFVGYENSTQFHVIEQSRVLPTFCMYRRVDISKVEEPKGFVTFMTSERIQRIVIWMNYNFILDEEYEAESSINIGFIALRDNKYLVIKMELNGQMTIKTDDIELAGTFIQSLCEYLKITDLQSNCDFPNELENLQTVLAEIEQFNNVRQQLTSQMADHSSIIRSLVVRAEDSRLMDDFEGMKKHYFELMNTNRDLISGYKIRSNNHKELLNHVKLLNQVIQKAGNLRMGRYKTDLISNARQAIKSNNSASLIKIIKTGSP